MATTPIFLPEKSHRRTWWATVLGVTESDMTKQPSARKHTHTHTHTHTSINDNSDTMRFMYRVKRVIKDVRGRALLLKKEVGGADEE